MKMAKNKMTWLLKVILRETEKHLFVTVKAIDNFTWIEKTDKFISINESKDTNSVH